MLKICPPPYLPDSKLPMTFFLASAVVVTMATRHMVTAQEQAPVEGFKGPVRCAAFSPDGKTLAFGPTDWTVRLLQVATGRMRATRKGHAGYVFAIAFSPDGKTLATGGERFDEETWRLAGKFKVTGEVKLWDLPAVRERASLKNAEWVVALAFAPDGKTLAAGDGTGTVKLWDVSTGHERATLKAHADPVRCLAFSPDGKTLASGSEDKTPKLWEVVTGQERATFPELEGHVLAVTFAREGKVLMVYDNSNTVRLWDLVTGKEPTVVRLDKRRGPFTVAAFSADAKILATGSRDVYSASLWDVSTGKELAIFKPNGEVCCVTLSPDSKLLVLGGSNLFVGFDKRDKNGELKLWDVAAALKSASKK